MGARLTILRPIVQKKEKLRGYCLVCNRYYFFRNGLDTNSLQVNQHHKGVCQENRHDCVRIKTISPR